MNRRDAIYARQSVEKKDSLSISGQVDLCRRMAGEKEPADYRDAGDKVEQLRKTEKVGVGTHSVAAV